MHLFDYPIINIPVTIKSKRKNNGNSLGLVPANVHAVD